MQLIIDLNEEETEFTVKSYLSILRLESLKNYVEIHESYYSPYANKKGYENMLSFNGITENFIKDLFILKNSKVWEPFKEDTAIIIDMGSFFAASPVEQALLGNGYMNMKAEHLTQKLSEMIIKRKAHPKYNWKKALWIRLTYIFQY